MTGLAMAEAAVDLRCHRCSHAVGTAAVPMQFVGIFRVAAFGVIPPGHVEEIRKRCRACSWVNVFHPLTARRHLDTVEMK